MRIELTDAAKLDADRLARIAEIKARVEEEGPRAAIEEWEAERLERIERRRAYEVKQERFRFS